MGDFLTNRFEILIIILNLSCINVHLGSCESNNYCIFDTQQEFHTYNVKKAMVKRGTCCYSRALL